MTSCVEISAEADAPPVCSTVVYFHLVEYRAKWPEHLRGDAF